MHLTKNVLLLLLFTITASVQALEDNQAVPSITTLTKLAEQNDSEAQLKLGQFYLHSNSSRTNIFKAAHWFKAAAENGNAEAQFELAALYDFGQGVEKDYTKANHWYQKSAEQGVANAQFNLAYNYAVGDYGLPQNLQKAVYWYTKAADQGEPDSQYRLGLMHLNGQGTPIDKQTAITLLKLSAEQNNADAIKTLEKLGIAF